MKKGDKPRDQKVHSIDSGAGDGDVKLGSRVRGCLSIRKQGQGGADDDGSRRWRELFRDVVTALVNHEAW